MVNRLELGARLLICGILTVQLSGCGTIMYPERKGQKGGKIDAGVAILDGIGLLLFIIPGIIAFAVDFNNGTIYLPGGSLRSELRSKRIKLVKFDPRYSSKESIARIIKDQTGQQIALDQPGIQVAKLSTADEVSVALAKVQPKDQFKQIALLERR